MGLFKGIFDELKNELNTELEKAKRTGSSTEKANIEKIQKMFLGKSTYSKHHRDSEEINRPQPKSALNKPLTDNQKKINALKNKNYQMGKEQAYEQKKKTFGQSFESKHENSKHFSESTKNKQAMMSRDGKTSTVFANDLSKSDNKMNDVIEIKTVDNKKASNIGKKIINPENAKNAFIASIIFERKTWK